MSRKGIQAGILGGVFFKVCAYTEVLGLGMAARTSQPRTIPWIAFTGVMVALIAIFYPVSEGAYRRLPYIYLAYLTGVLLLFAFRLLAKTQTEEQT